MTDIPIALRPATSEDMPFFYSATLQSHFYSSPSCSNVLPSIYYPEHKKTLQRLLERPSIFLTIACLKDDPQVILGFMLSEARENVLHYMYVKRAFRRFGVARELMKALGIELRRANVSHWTDDMADIQRTKRYPELTYNPYLLARCSTCPPSL